MSRRELPKIQWDKKRQGQPATVVGTWTEVRLKEMNRNGLRALIRAHSDMARAIYRQRANGMTYDECRDEIYEAESPETLMRRMKDIHHDERYN